MKLTIWLLDFFGVATELNFQANMKAAFEIVLLNFKSS